MSKKDQELKYNRELYKQLSKEYTKEELVEAFVFPPDMTEQVPMTAFRGPGGQLDGLNGTVAFRWTLGNRSPTLQLAQQEARGG
ncbi:MAG: hypothetical protein AAFO07_30175, partial [Bacteroidota bacterium]